MPMTDEKIKAAREAAALGNTTGALQKSIRVPGNMRHDTEASLPGHRGTVRAHGRRTASGGQTQVAQHQRIVGRAPAMQLGGGWESPHRVSVVHPSPSEAQRWRSEHWDGTALHSQWFGSEEEATDHAHGQAHELGLKHVEHYHRAPGKPFVEHEPVKRMRKSLDAGPAELDASKKTGGQAISKTNMDKEPPKRRRKCCGKPGCSCRKCKQGLADQALTGGG